jgi:hypothetical protein
MIDGAVDIGRGRLLTAIAVLVVAVVLLVIAIVLVGRRRSGLPPDPAAGSPYATLADQPSRPLDGDPRPTELPSPELPETEPPPAARGDAS